MALNVEQTIVDTVWALLAGRGTLVTLLRGPGGLHRQSEAGGGGFVRDQVNTTPAQYPQVTMSAVAGAQAITTPTFGQHLSPAQFNQTIKQPVDLTLKATIDTKTETAQTAVETEIEAALWSAGPTLGLAWLAPIRVRKTRSYQNVAGATRMVVTYTINVEARPRIAQLTA